MYMRHCFHLVVFQVIICTDGLANKGVGNLEGKYTFTLNKLCIITSLSVEKGKEAKSAQTFYEDVGTVSLEKWYI